MKLLLFMGFVNVYIHLRIRNPRVPDPAKVTDPVPQHYRQQPLYFIFGDLSVKVVHMIWRKHASIFTYVV
jgi:hypothetical protein